MKLTDELIDAITDAQWGKGCKENQYLAHRAYARAIERAVLAAPPPDFCDAHCTWMDHHPDCERAEPSPAQCDGLYRAVNELMAYLGAHGHIEAKGDRAQAVMDALHEYDSAKLGDGP
jgi:hypothetical protein